MRGDLWLGLALRYLADQRGKLCLLILVLFGCDLRRSALTAFMTGLMRLHGLLKTGRATVVQRLIDFRHFCGHAQTVDLTTGGAVLLSLVEVCSAGLFLGAEINRGHFLAISCGVSDILAGAPHELGARNIGLSLVKQFARMVLVMAARRISVGIHSRISLVRGVEQRVFLLAVGRPAFLVLGAVGSVDAFVAWLMGAGRLRVGLRMLVFTGAIEHDGVTAGG